MQLPSWETGTSPSPASIKPMHPSFRLTQVWAPLPSTASPITHFCTHTGCPLFADILTITMQPHWGPGISPRLDLNLSMAEPGRLAQESLVKRIHKWVRWIHKCTPPPPPLFVLLFPVDSPHPQLEARCWGQGSQLSLALSTRFFSRLMNPRVQGWKDSWWTTSAAPPPCILPSVHYNEHMLGTHM